MALNNIQERIERSFYKSIEAVLVTEGYLPSRNSTDFPNTEAGQEAWDAALKVIANAKGFATELFGYGSGQSKGLKKVPRIAIITRRVMPGDIGAPGTVGFEKDKNDPNTIRKILVDYQTSNIHIDVHLISNSAAQDRFLHAVMHAAIGNKRHIVFFDNPNERFFSEQFNHYDTPDETEGIIEKIYSFEVKDIFLYEEYDSTTNVSLINDITVETTVAQLETIFLSNGYIIGPYVADGGVHIDLSSLNI